MPGILRKSRRHRLSRRTNNGANRPQPTVAISIQSLSAAGTDVTIVFDQPVTVKGTPAYTTDVAGAVATSVAVTNPTTLVLTFDQDVSAATVLNVPYEEPSVRNSSGGFVAPSALSF